MDPVLQRGGLTFFFIFSSRDAARARSHETGKSLVFSIFFPALKHGINENPRGSSLYL
jgi:hypothetical protein